MVSVLHNELEYKSEKAQVQEIGDHAAEDQKQRRTSSRWSKPSPISPHEVLQSWLIYTVYHLRPKNNNGWGGRERVKREEGPY